MCIYTKLFYQFFIKLVIDKDFSVVICLRTLSQRKFYYRLRHSIQPFWKMADSKQTDIKTLSEPTKDFNNIAAGDPKNMQDLTQYVQALLQQMQDKFQTMSDQIIARIDDMGNRIDELEKNIADLMTQAGIEEIEK